MVEGVNIRLTRLTECPGCHSKDPDTRGETIEWDGGDPVDGEGVPSHCPDRYGFHKQLPIVKQLGEFIATSTVLPFGIKHISFNTVSDSLHQKAKEVVLLLCEEAISEIAALTDPHLNRLEEGFDRETQRRFWGATYLECDEESKTIMLAWYGIIDATSDKIMKLKGTTEL